jgi:hypothetical protein
VTQPGDPPSVRHSLTGATQRVPSASLGKVRGLVYSYVAAAASDDQSADARIGEAIEALRGEPEFAVIEIARALGETKLENYPARMGLILAANALEHEQALPLLVSIAETPIPTEASPPGHGLGATAEEVILRTTAVDGIGRLARQGTASALSALISLAESPVFSIRRASVHAALVARPRDKTTRQRLLESLPSSQHFLLDLKAPSVAEVPQPEPNRKRTAHTERPPDPANRQRRPPRGRPPSSAES